MVRYLFYTIGDLTYQSPLVFLSTFYRGHAVARLHEVLRYKHASRGFDF